jgi:phosphate transport system substrate-binding protein
MNRLLRVLGGAIIVLTAAAPAAAGDPAQTESGTIRVWSNEAMRGVVARWQQGFSRSHRGVTIVATPIGTDVAMAGLYTGRADIALMGREPTASEVQAFEWIFQSKPARIEIMNGSLAVPEKSPTLVVFVHRDNPLSRLTLAQLDAIFGHEHRRGLDPIVTWGQLGLRGDWAARAIALYGPDATSGTGVFFRHAVLNDSRTLNWDRMREFSDEKGTDGAVHSAGSRIVDALAGDRFGMAVADLGFANTQVKALALSADERGPFVNATTQNVGSRTYPLTRTAFALFKRLPGRPLDPKIQEFLTYILSDEGQAEVGREGDYLRLPANVVREQLRTLE